MFETIRQTKKEQMLVFTLIGAMVGFCLGVLFYESPGDRIVAQAKQIMAVVALAGSSDGKQLATLGVENGQPAKKCHSALLNPCKAKIGPNDDKGEPTLVSTDPKRPIKNVMRTDKIFIFTYEGSRRCQGSVSGGVHIEKCPGREQPPCLRPNC